MNEAQVPSEFFPDREDKTAYYQEMGERIVDGETVWLPRNLDSTLGNVYDLFSRREYIGFVEQDEYGDCDIYLAAELAEGEGPNALNDEPVSLADAVEILEAMLLPDDDPES